VQIDDIDNLRIVENVHIPSEITSDVVDNLVKSSTLTLDEPHVYKESISGVQDALLKSSTPILDDTDVSEDDTSDSKHILVESNMPVQVARYSLVIPVIEDGIEHEIVDTSVVLSSKPSEFSCANVVMYFFSSNESVKFFIMAHQVTPNISCFSEYLELFLTLVIFLFVLVMLYH